VLGAIPHILDPLRLRSLSVLGLDKGERAEELEDSRKISRLSVLLPQLKTLILPFELYRGVADIVRPLSPRAGSQTGGQLRRPFDYSPLTGLAFGSFTAWRNLQQGYEIRRGNNSSQAFPPSLYVNTLRIPEDHYGLPELRRSFERLEDVCERDQVEIHLGLEMREYEIDSFISEEFCGRRGEGLGRREGEET
jgi:hypothetical protein